jgi:hypothetical protein
MRAYLIFNNRKPIGKRVPISALFQRRPHDVKTPLYLPEEHKPQDPKFVDYLLHQSFCGRRCRRAGCSQGHDRDRNLKILGVQEKKNCCAAGCAKHPVFFTGQGGLPDGLDGLRWSSPVHSFWWTAMTQSGISSGLDGLVQISVDWVGLQSRLT